MPTACLILIGNEILSGRTKDKNLPYISEKLSLQGVRMAEVRIIADIEEEIIKTVNECRAKYDYIFTTGGIGPTHDDITSACIANAFGVPLERNQQVEADLRAYYKGRHVNDARLKMADMPQGASTIPNPISTAPGFVIGNVYVMAGVPSICSAMIDRIAPTLKGGAPMQAVAYDIDKAEGDLADMLTKLQNNFPALEIGVYPRYEEGKLSSHVVMRGNDEVALQAADDELQDSLKTLNITSERA